MSTTNLSSKGQIIIPKAMRSSHDWQPGQQFEIIDTGDGILLKEASPFTPARLDQVAGYLPHKGPTKTLEEMDEAIRRGVAEVYCDRR